MDDFQTLQHNCFTAILTWLTMVPPSLTKMERRSRLQPSAQFVTKRCGITSQMTAVFMIKTVPVVLPRFILSFFKKGVPVILYLSLGLIHL